MNELTYTRCGDYYIPDLKLSEQPEAPIGKYGRMRQRYLKEHRPGLYNSLILSEKLYPHLLEIDRATCERMDAMLPRMMEAAGVTEELKARDPMRWVGLMNTLKTQAEEVIFQELILYLTLSGNRGFSSVSFCQKTFDITRYRAYTEMVSHIKPKGGVGSACL